MRGSITISVVSKPMTQSTFAQRSKPMESGGRQISKDEVIAKLKDDGDFDNLRLKIIRKLKDNEELRNSIVSVVKQSAVLTRPGAENMKRRQLSDTIHEEVGNKIMSAISDHLWEIIRSKDGMNSEIKETVQSVYNKILNPKGKEGESSSLHDAIPARKDAENRDLLCVSANEKGQKGSDDELKGQGFSACTNQSINSGRKHQEMQPHLYNEKRPTRETKKHDGSELDNDDLPPGFSAVTEHEQPCSGSDEDLDVPPGFG